MPDLIHSETFRGDSPDLAQVNERIDCVKNGGGTTDTPAFFSTSTSEYIAKCFSGTCVTLDNNILDHHLGHNPGSQNATLNQAQDINALTLQIQHLELSPVHMEV